MRQRTLPLLLIALTACDAPPELGDGTDADADLTDANLADVLPLLFRDADADAPRVRALVLALEREVAAEALDFTAGRKEREFTLEPLPRDRLGTVTPPEGTTADNLVSVAVFSRSTHDLDGMVSVQRQANQVCIESSSTVFYRRTFTSDEACLDADTCDVASSEGEVRKELSILDAGWYDFHKDFRRLVLDDGRRVLIARGFIPDVYPLEKGGFAYQTYSLEVWLERDGVTERTYALWGELDIGLTEVAMLDLTSDALHENHERQDLFLDGDLTYCKQDRDRVYDRPTD